MTEVKFTHTTYQTDVFIFPEQVIAVLAFLPTMKSTVIIGPGSTAIPITDTPEEAIKKINQAKKANNKEKVNGVSKRKHKST